MAYTDSKIQAIGDGRLSGTTGDFAATAAALCRVNQPCDLFAVGVLILIAPTAESTLTITRRVIPGTDGSGATAATPVAVITIPSLTVIGRIVWKACHSTVAGVVVIAPVKLNAGDELLFSMAGTTLTWKPWFEAYPRPEVKENNSNFLKSA
jgi:hypothetical protein